ncbi:MAG: squalene/phytoene synthase family protein [Bdellovibrionales bacterium]
MFNGISYCGELVRNQDPDRFLLSQFAPLDRRAALWALFAFHYEIAKTRDVVSETRLGLIRLQWWRDAVAAIYDPPLPRGYGVTSGGAVPEHAVVQALADVIKVYDLPREWFDTLIYAREFDLEDVLPADLEGVLHYADFTGTPLLKAAVRVVGGAEEVEPVQVVASNYALAGILRSVPYLAARRRCLLPQDAMTRHGVYTNQLYEGKSSGDLPAVVRAVADAFVWDVKPENRSLSKFQCLAQMTMRQLRSCDYDVFHPRMRIDPPFKALRLFLGL